MEERLSRFLEAVRCWAEAQSGIEALLLVGSQARGAARADSDVDLVILCCQPLDFLTDTRWAEQFGCLQNAEREDYGALQALRVFYAPGLGCAGGLEVEYGFVLASWASSPLDPGTEAVLSGGWRVIHGSLAVIQDDR